MKHSFYNKNKKEQRNSLIALAIFSVAIIVVLIIISISYGCYLFGILACTVTLSVVAPFFDVPSLKKIGSVIYYSPLFIGEKPKDGLATIHGGTLFDYYYVIDRKMTGKQRLNFIISEYLNGLLAFIEDHKDIEQLKVRGTSYIINERTAGKLGFRVVDTYMLQKIILIYNYPNILISNCIANKKLSFPDLRKVKTFEADISKLIDRKAYIENLRNSMYTSSSQT